MNSWFLVKCFLIGLSAASAVGPIFVLTFNNGALRGFVKGFFTGLGAAIGDGLLLLLGLIGILSFFEDSQRYQIGIDFAGGFLLLIFGISMFFSHKKIDAKPILVAPNLTLTVFKTFLATVLNPITLFFFMFISSQLLETGPQPSRSTLIFGSLMASLGSLTILTTVAYIASRLGNAISTKNLRIISFVTGSIVIGIGGYFFFDALRVLYSLHAPKLF
jgi:threonine/homoserine/homoserine lactone efflux protein